MFLDIRRCISILEKTGISPNRLINGNDLIDAGVPPAETLGDVLEAVYDAQLEGAIGAKDEALNLALAIYKDFQDSEPN